MNSLNILNILFPVMAEKQAIQEDLFSKKRITSFIISFAQFITILLIIRNFNIEKGSGISAIGPIILGAFILNSLPPIRFRPAILFSTSIAVIYYAFGYFSGNLMIIAGLSLIACCHLPINFSLRILLIVLITGGIAILRLDLFYAPRAEIVVPFIASMFMFRLLIYLYELKHNPTPASLMQQLSYFFLFPNHGFLLFPIIDYKTYLKTYYSKADHELWQKGIRWMLRGVFHLLAYRIIYYHLLIGPGEVVDLTSLLQYMICSYALILRLSGLFHFILGLLIMFGFDLHPIFNNYFLATSFVDMWRRINIYWREFIMKLFFYPIMFKLKKKNNHLFVACNDDFCLYDHLGNAQLPMVLDQRIFSANLNGYCILADIRYLYNNKFRVDRKNNGESSKKIQYIHPLSIERHKNDGNVFVHVVYVVFVGKQLIPGMVLFIIQSKRVYIN